MRKPSHHSDSWKVSKKRLHAAKFPSLAYLVRTHFIDMRAQCFCRLHFFRMSFFFFMARRRALDDFEFLMALSISLHRSTEEDLWSLPPWPALSSFGRPGPVAPSSVELALISFSTSFSIPSISSKFIPDILSSMSPMSPMSPMSSSSRPSRSLVPTDSVVMVDVSIPGTSISMSEGLVPLPAVRALFL